VSGQGHNNPPVTVEFTVDEATFLRDALDAEVGAALNILAAVQDGTFTEDVAVKVVAKMEAVRPILAKFKEALK
jgi:hypothetical protein